VKSTALRTLQLPQAFPETLGIFLRHAAGDLHQHLVLDIDLGGEQPLKPLAVFAYLLQVRLGLERKDTPPNTLSLRRYREAHLLLVGLRDEAAVPFAVYLLRLADLEPLVAEGLYNLLGFGSRFTTASSNITAKARPRTTHPVIRTALKTDNPRLLPTSTQTLRYPGSSSNVGVEHA
jgi:hypothetical protein